MIIDFSHLHPPLFSGKIVKINESRILLCEATASIMKVCFDILGIRTVQKM